MKDTEPKVSNNRKARVDYRAKTRAHNKRNNIQDPRDTDKWPVGSIWEPC